MPSNRYSVVSTSETYASGLGTTESNPLFRQSQSFASMSQAGGYGNSSEMRADHNVSNLALPSARGAGRDPSPASTESGGSGSAALLERGQSDDPSTFSHSSSGMFNPYQPYTPDSYLDEAEQPILPSHGGLSTASFASPEAAYRTAPLQASPYSDPEDQRPNLSPINTGTQRQPSHGRGFSLTDPGIVPVAGMKQVDHQPVRRISRQQTQNKRTSRNNLVSPTSSNSHTSNLPPGAVSFQS